MVLDWKIATSLGFSRKNCTPPPIEDIDFFALTPWSFPFFCIDPQIFSSIFDVPPEISIDILNRGGELQFFSGKAPYRYWEFYYTLTKSSSVLYKPNTNVCFRQIPLVYRALPNDCKSTMEVYISTCILVLMTSTGVFPKTLAAPATPPIIKVLTIPISFVLSPSCNHNFRLLYTKKRIAWLLPCFITVAVNPW